MRNTNNNRKRKTLLILAGICMLIIICLYFSVLISSFIGNNPTLNFRTALETVSESGFDFSVFAVIGGIGVFILLLSVFSTGINHDSVEHPIDKNRTVSEQDNYGKAQFEKPEQYRSLAQIRPIEKCIGHIYGMLDNEGRQCIDFFADPNDPTAHINNHIFAIGASGSGKTYTVGLTYCYQTIKMEHSFIATDPKGELFQKLANVFRDNGYIVRRLDFVHPEKSDGWNCMKAFNYARTLSEKQNLITNFVAAIVAQMSSPDSGGKDIFNVSGPSLILRALIMRLVLDPTIPQEEKTLRTVYDWLHSCNNSDEKLEKYYFNKKTIPAEAMSCLGPWLTYKNSSDNLAGNIVVNLVSALGILDDRIILDMLSTDDIDIALPGREKCAYFVQFPVPGNQYRFPMALFFTMLFDTLQAQASLNHNLRNKRDVDFFLDEFAQIGTMPQWDERMATIRSQGLNVFMLVQTMAQFESIYGSKCSTIMSNCATWLVLGTNDNYSARIISERIGQTTIQVETVSEDYDILGRPTGRKKVSRGTGKANLLSPDEITKMPANTVLIVIQKRNPIFANAIVSDLHPLSRGIKPAYEEEEHFFYDYDNLYNGLPTRNERNSAEIKRIAVYKDTHVPYSAPSDIYDAPYGSLTEKLRFFLLSFKKLAHTSLLFKYIHNVENEPDISGTESYLSVPDDNPELFPHFERVADDESGTGAASSTKDITDDASEDARIKKGLEELFRSLSHN